MDKESLKITLAGGRSGVGKSTIVLNLCMTLLQKEKKVCLLDANLQAPKIATKLKLPPGPSLAEFLEQRCALSALVKKGPEGLSLISGAWALERFNTPEEARSEPEAELSRFLMEQDVVVVDAPAGVSEETLNLLTAADIPVLAATPEPSSLTSAFSVLRAFRRRSEAREITLIINRVSTGAQAEAAANKFVSAAKKLLQIKVRPSAFLPEDFEFAGEKSGSTSIFSFNPSSQAAHSLRASLFFVEAAQEEDITKTIWEGELQNRPKEKEADESISSPFPVPPVDVSYNLFDPGQEDVGDIIRLLIKENLLSKTQVQYAKKVQQKLETPKLLLEILRDLGYLREDELKEALSKNRSSIRLGSLLFELGFISKDQLEKALKKQKASEVPKCLGEIITENKYISEYDLAQVLHLQLGFSYVEPRLGMLDAKCMNAAPKDVFLKHKILPLQMENGVLKVAMSDPLDCSSLEKAKELFGQNITPMLTMERFIVNILNDYQPPEATQKETLDVTAGPGPEQLVNELIREALDKKAAVVHIEPLKNRIRIRIRRDGSMITLREMSRDSFPRMVSHLKSLAGVDPNERVRHQLGRISFDLPDLQKEINLLTSFYVTPLGDKITLRVQVQKTDFFSLTDLGMGPRLLDRFREEVLEAPGGVLLIVGPLESGRTTTLFSAVSYFNNDHLNIMTAEEPVEYMIEGISQCSINPNIGLTLQTTLQHILQQDPDIIVLGEIRDKFAAAGAFQAALTGYKIMTTFHAEDPVGAIFRLQHLDLENFVISSSLKGALSQRLLRRLCPFCREDYSPSPRDLRRLKFQPPDIGNYGFQVGTGCEFCNFTGYKGRVGVFELLTPNEKIREAVVGRKSFLEIRRIALETAGMVTLVEDGLSKAANGITSLQEVISRLPVIEPPRPLDKVTRLIGDI